MTDGADLLAAILACPEDDALRLVYADWLSENGDDLYAQFIRVSIELHNKPSHIKVRVYSGGFAQSAWSWVKEPNPVHRELADKKSALWGLLYPENRSFMFGSYEMLWDVRQSQITQVWRRGFIEELHTKYHELVKCHKLLEQQPIRVVSLGPEPYISECLVPDPPHSEPCGIRHYTVKGICEVDVPNPSHFTSYNTVAYLCRVLAFAYPGREFRASIGTELDCFLLRDGEMIEKKGHILSLEPAEF